MRILFPCGLFYPSKLGGPANTLYWLTKGLVKEGLDISVVTSNRHIEHGLIQENIWTIIDGIRIRYCTAHGKFPIRIIWHAAREMNHSDVVVFSSICYLPNFPLAVKAKLKRKKIIWSPRGELLDEALEGNKIKLVYFKILKHLLNTNVLFHATSEAEKQSINSIFGDETSVVVIPNLMELPQKESRNEDAKHYLLYLGRIAPIKALDNLIEALPLSKNFMQSDYVLRIVGGVEKQFERYYVELLELIHKLHLEKKVEFVGQMHGREKYVAYANAKFTFLISHSENFGNVVIESLSQGTPVVASKGTPWQSLELYDAGYWIDNSPTAIAQCIDEIIKLSDQDYKVKQEGALSLVKRYDVYENVQLWTQVLK